jgi:dihydroorotase
VSPAHLYFCDEDLETYDTNLKISPPLRTAKDREALLAGIKDGTIDCIASHHVPHHTDQKVVEFEYAQPGMISLQTAFSVVRTVLPQLSIERLMELFSTNARQLFGLPAASISEGSAACLTLFNPDEKWMFNKERNISRSLNSPYFGKELIGRATAIINKGGLITYSEK